MIGEGGAAIVGKILLGVLWTVLGVLGLLLFLVLALSLVPAHIYADYEDGALLLRVRYGPVKLTLYPRSGEERPEKKPRRKKREKEKEKESESGETPRKKKLSLNLDQLLCCLEELPPILGRALRRVGRRLRIRPFFLHILVAGEDPAATAILYGRLSAALWALRSAAANAVHVRDADVRLFLDFRRSAPDCIAHIGVSLRLWDLLVTAVCAGASGLKWLLHVRKLASPPPAETKQKASVPPPGDQRESEDNSAA